MTTLIIALGIELGILGLVALLLWLFVGLPIEKEKKLRKDPFTKSLRNNPGQSALKKVEDLYDNYLESFAAIFMVAGMLIGFLTATFMPSDVRTTKTAVLASIAAAGFCGWFIIKMRRALKKRMKYRLGFEGERHTAQAIEILIKDGYSIYHDFPGKKADGTVFNIDHVLIGPAGVIIIETKARSKNPSLKGQDSAKVLYDGRKIQFPGGTEVDCLGQAKANSSYLAEKIKGRIGMRIGVRSAVCFPGWFFPPTKEVEVHVCNPEMLPKWVRGLSRTTLTEIQLTQIRSLVEESVTVPTG